MITPDRLTEIRHIAPTAGPLGQAAINELLAEVERLTAFHVAYLKMTAALGFGDNITEPAAKPDELVDPLLDAQDAQLEHLDCPLWCDHDGQWEKPRSCGRCNGSGCLPNAALAYLECDDCGGDGTNHERYSIGDEYALDELRAELEELRRNGAGTVQQLRTDLAESRADVEFYSNCYDAAREALAETNAKLDRSHAELADLQRRHQEADDSIEWMDARCNGRQPLNRKDCCGAPWDAPHRGTCEDAK